MHGTAGPGFPITAATRAPSKPRWVSGPSAVVNGPAAARPDSPPPWFRTGRWWSGGAAADKASSQIIVDGAITAFMLAISSHSSPPERRWAGPGHVWSVHGCDIANSFDRLQPRHAAPSVGNGTQAARFRLGRVTPDPLRVLLKEPPIQAFSHPSIAPCIAVAYRVRCVCVRLSVLTVRGLCVRRSCRSSPRRGHTRRSQAARQQVQR
jgi:hypothetical protein